MATNVDSRRAMLYSALKVVIDGDTTKEASMSDPKQKAIAKLRILLGEVAGDSIRDKQSNAEFIDTLEAMRDLVESKIKACKEH